MLFAGAERGRQRVGGGDPHQIAIRGQWPAQTGKEIGVENGHMNMDHMIQKRSPRFEPQFTRSLL
jgi:hypothetical protein